MLSEFSFTPPLSWGSEDSSAAERAPVCVDEDGDLDVPRRYASTIHVLIIGKGHSIDINRGHSESCIKCLLYLRAHYGYAHQWSWCPGTSVELSYVDGGINFHSHEHAVQIYCHVFLLLSPVMEWCSSSL